MISVIVPIYNAEKYIDRCVNSIMAQTYSDWELFLVDDGSKDDSLKIIREYERKDDRITVIHQENQGAGKARNKGLTCSSGEYVVFVDADDYLERNYFTLLSKHDEEIVFIDVNRRDENGKILAEERLSGLREKDKDYIIRGQMTGKILWGGVRKAVKRDLLYKNNIKYSEHKVGEEAIYSFLLLYYAKEISFIEEAVYNYEVHSNSLSQSYQKDPWGAVSLALRDKVKELGCYDEYADTLNSFIVTATIVSLSKVAQNERYVDYLKYAKSKKMQMDNLIDTEQKIDYAHMKTKAKILFHFVRNRLYTIVFLICKIAKIMR